MKEAEGVKSEVGFELGRFELTSKSVQTFPKSYAGRIRDGSTFAYKSKDWSKMIQSRIWINGSSDAKFCQLSNGALAFWIRNLVMEQNGFFWLDPIPFHGFLDVRKNLSNITVCHFCLWNKGIWSAGWAQILELHWCLWQPRNPCQSVRIGFLRRP